MDSSEPAANAAATMPPSGDAAAAATAALPHTPVAAIAAAATTIDVPSSSIAATATVCLGCGASGLSEYEASIGQYICLGCGRVDSGASGSGAAESQLREEEEYHDGHRLGVFVSRTAPTMLSKSAVGPGLVHATLARTSTEQCHETIMAHKRVTRRLHDLLSALHLPHSLAPQAQLMLVTTTAGHYGDGRRTDLVLGACIYALCRLSHRPLSLLDVSAAVSANVFKLASVVQRVLDANKLRLPELDPNVFVERILSKVAEHMTREGREDSATLLMVRVETVALLQLARGHWLDAGRSPAGLCGAAVAVVLLAHDSTFSLAVISATLHIGVQTLRARMRELKSALYSLARTHFPWLSADHARDDQMVVHLPFVLENLSMLIALQDAEAAEIVASAKTQSSASSSATSSPRPTLSPISSSAPSSPAFDSLEPPASSVFARTISESTDPPSFQRSCLKHAAGQVHRQVSNESSSVGFVSMSHILTDADLPESQLDLYIRSAEEVHALNQLQSRAPATTRAHKRNYHDVETSTILDHPAKRTSLHPH